MVTNQHQRIFIAVTNILFGLQGYQTKQSRSLQVEGTAGARGFRMISSVRFLIMSGGDGSVPLGKLTVNQADPWPC